MMDLEAVYQALFNRVKNLSGIVTASRRPRLPQDVGLEELPALFQEQMPLSVRYQGENLPPVFTLRADLGIYVDVANQTAVPSSLLNPLIQAVCSALEPDPDEENQTLGGLVQWCRLGGQIEINEGIITGKAIAVIPVEMLAV
jgi:hypothetical protein